MKKNNILIINCCNCKRVFEVDANFMISCPYCNYKYFYIYEKDGNYKIETEDEDK